MSINWSAAGFATRVVVATFRWWKGTQPRVTIDVRRSYETRFRRYAFDIRVTNDNSQSLTLDTLRVLRPPGGGLRDDPPRLAFFLEDDLDAEREKMLGNAVHVLPVEIDLPPRGQESITFVFMPPQEWRGGDFVAELSITVHGAKEEHHKFRISKTLSPQD
jgi:hypothetical protein